MYRDGHDDEAQAGEMQRLAEHTPRLRELFALYEDVDVEKATNDDLDYGLDRLLDSLQARLGTITR